MSDKTKELRALTGLRGIAALSVVLGHYAVGDLTDVLKVFYWKNAAVDLFFCLSGFTLCVAYNAGRGNGLPFRAYLGARLGRIYPLFVISLAAMALFRGHRIMGEYQQQLEIRDFIQQLLMVNAWPFFGTGIHWDFPAWSVSVEFFCYLFVFPAAFHASRQVLRVDWKVRAALGAVLMAISAVLFLRYWGDGRLITGFSRWPGTALPPFPYFVPVIRGILGMLAGWLTYFSYLSRDRFWRSATRSADLLVLAALGFLVCDALKILPNQWMLPLFPVLILGLSADASLSSRLIASKPVHYLGAISYSVYLLHILWRRAFGLVTGIAVKDMPHHPVSFFALFGGLILLAGLSYRFVEMPLRGLIRTAFAARSPSGRLIPAMRWALPVVLVGFALMQAQWAGLLGPPLNPPVALGEDVARPPMFQRVAGDGWSAPEDWGTWSLGRRSVLVIPLSPGRAASAKLAVKGVFFVSAKHPDVTVHFSANGVPLATLTGTSANPAIDRVIDLPPDVFAATPRRLELVIAIDNPTSPLALGMSADDRIIGFGLKSLMLVDGRGLP